MDNIKVAKQLLRLAKILNSKDNEFVEYEENNDIAKNIKNIVKQKSDLSKL